MEQSWSSCLTQLLYRGVDIDKIPECKKYFSPERKSITIEHFKKDLEFFP